ncbi:hypothetical protein DP144_00190 [Clostridium tetani]|uniref:hypothetical protein n=1 Tax=Clostridium tetani TaxID=1513 RepID=UPI00100A7B91|nr:hypothetical protein [Clostridium tetani]RXM79265.1 hypothetical protein DP154_00190 [Clostridium tetani]RYV00077.1 hypothetical protein DP144_00190 [Clostridium tetani]
MEQNYMEKDYIEEVFEDLFFNSVIDNIELKNDKKYKKENDEYNFLYEKLEKELSNKNKELLNKIYEKRINLNMYESKFAYRQAFKNSINILKKLHFI